MTDNVLAPYRVLDLTDESGWLCGKILGDLGADVVKVDFPPSHSPVRNAIEQETGGRGVRLSHLAYNTSKRSITLKLEHPIARFIFRRLAQSADFVI